MKSRQHKTFKRRKKNLKIAGFPKFFTKLFTSKRTSSKRTPTKLFTSKRTPSKRRIMMQELIDQYGDIRGRKPQDKELANIINEISLNLDKDTINIYKEDIQQILYEIIDDLKKRNPRKKFKNLNKIETSILEILKKMGYVEPDAPVDILYNDIKLLDKIKDDLKFDDPDIRNLL